MTEEENVARPEKVAVVDEVRSELADNPATLLTEYRGLSVSDLAELRSELRQAGARYVIVKNTLARIAARDAGFEALAELLTGPTALTYCDEDPVGPAKALRRFAKAHPQLMVKGGILEGRVVDAETADKLADLESREELLQKLAGLMYGALANTASLLQAPLGQMARLVAALEEKGEAPAGEPEAADEEPATGAPADAATEDAEPEAGLAEAAEAAADDPDAAEESEEVAEPEAAEDVPAADESEEVAEPEAAEDEPAADEAPAGEAATPEVASAEEPAEATSDAVEAVADVGAVAVEAAADIASDAAETVGEVTGAEDAAATVAGAVASAAETVSDAVSAAGEAAGEVAGDAVDAVTGDGDGGDEETAESEDEDDEK
jgi:large subunit ribosomal protein L10